MTQPNFSPILIAGKPMFGAFADEKMLAFCTVAFVLMFYAPGDLFYGLITFKPFYIAICTVKEVFRGKKIWYGLADGVKAFPNSPVFIPVVVAVIKGNGSAFMNPFSK